MRIAIIGGGISGLALAWNLRKRHGSAASIILLEKSARLGGWIRTEDRDGYLFELGPRSCRPEGAGVATVELVEELGLQSELISASPAARLRYLYTGGKLQALPTGVVSLLTSPLTRPLIWPLLKEWRVARGTGDETVDQFAARRLGRYAADRLFDPMVRGIFAGDSRQLSMRACFPSLYHLEQRWGSLTKGLLRSSRDTRSVSPFVRQVQRGGLFSFRRGMETLVQTLQRRLESDIDIRCGVDMQTLDHPLIREADHIYVTTPAFATAELLAKAAPEVSALLSETPFVSVASVCLGYPEPLLPYQGFGYLIPSREGESILGMVWDSSVFPQQNKWPSQTRLTVMMRLEKPMDSSTLESLAREAAARHLGIGLEPEVVGVAVSQQAIPQYTVGHIDRVLSVETHMRRLLPNITLLGNSLYGVAVNDCIAHAAQVSRI